MIDWGIAGWNYNIALEDYSVMQGQAHNIDDLGAKNWKVNAHGDAPKMQALSNGDAPKMAGAEQRP